MAGDLGGAPVVRQRRLSDGWTLSFWLTTYRNVLTYFKAPPDISRSQFNGDLVEKPVGRGPKSEPDVTQSVGSIKLVAGCPWTTPNFRYKRLKKRKKNAVLWYDFQLTHATSLHTTSLDVPMIPSLAHL